MRAAKSWIHRGGAIFGVVGFVAIVAACDKGTGVGTAAPQAPSARINATPATPLSGASPSSSAAASAVTSSNPGPKEDATMLEAPKPSPSTRVDLSRPIPVDPGESIAHITLGMNRSDIAAIGIALTPEGINRADRTGYLAGPLQVLVDASDRVTLVAVDLAASPGIVVAGRSIPSTATLDTLEKAISGCTRARGSGGDYLDCRGATGKLVHFYGSYGRPGISVILDAALLR